MEHEIDKVVKGSWTEDFAANALSNDSAKVGPLQWTYWNAFFFGFHLCSTIGYGDVSPSTGYGRLLAVLYSTVGMPLHILFFKQLGESFALSYQETIWLIRKKDNSCWNKIPGDLVFFLPWTVVIFIVPAIVFMFTEDWGFIEGVYYSFITLSTVGLGDYVAGLHVSHPVYFVLCKIILFFWMIYGLAFTTIIVDYLTHLYQMNLLFYFKYTWPCVFRVKRFYIDIEKLDIHFRLLRAEGVKHQYSMWAVRKGARKNVYFQTSHMANLAVLAERIQLELMSLFPYYEGSTDGQERKAYPVDAFPVRKRSSDYKGLESSE